MTHLEDPRFLPKDYPLRLEAATFVDSLMEEGLIRPEFGARLSRMYVRWGVNSTSKKVVEAYIRDCATFYRRREMPIAIFQRFGIFVEDDDVGIE